MGFQLTPMDFAEAHEGAEEFLTLFQKVATDDLAGPGLGPGPLPFPSNGSGKRAALSDRSGGAAVEVVFSWAIPQETLRTSRRGYEVISDLFHIAGVFAPVQLKFWPKGSADANKGWCSIAHCTGLRAQEVDTRVEFFHRAMEREWSWSSQLQDHTEEVCHNFCKTPASAVTLTVKRGLFPSEAGGKFVGLEVWLQQ